MIYFLKPEKIRFPKLMNWCWSVFLLLVFCITGSRQLIAQVKVTYDSENSILTVANKSGQEIILFSNDIKGKKDVENVFEPNSFKKAEPSGISTLLKYYTTIRKTLIFDNIKPKPAKIVYFEFVDVKGQYALTNRIEILAKDFEETKRATETPKTEENMATILETATEAAAPVQPAPASESKETKPADKTPANTKPKVTQTPAVVAVVNPYREKIDKLFDESKDKLLKNKERLTLEEKNDLSSIEKRAMKLKQTIEVEKSALEKKKENKKVKCNNCDELLAFAKESILQIDYLTGQIHRILASLSDQEIELLKKEYWDEVLKTIARDTTTLQMIKTEIAKRNKHALWGWMGLNKIKNKLRQISGDFDQINEKSITFIQQKLLFCNDDYDRAVISDLDKEIPIGFKDIAECERELNSIEIPYTKLSMIGIIFLLLLAGIAFYVRTIFVNKKFEKIEQEKKSSGTSGLLIEDDDIVEVITYKVGLSEVKAKAGEDYYVVDMNTIFDDTSIKDVYLSRKAILDIYKFFSGFLRYDDKTNETGCFLVGRWEYAPNTNQEMYDISIESVVEPSDDAVYGEYALNFGAKIGITLNFAIEKLCEKTGNEYVHTAWMHSHPGLGLFLSSQDLSVQSQLAHSQHQTRMLAIVLDSNTPDFQTAFFTPKRSGVMNNDTDVKQFLSLENLYQWAKTSHVVEKQSTPAPVSQNFFSFDVANKTNTFNKVLISGAAIIDMDMAIMPDAYGLRGCFMSTKQGKELTINEFKECESDEPVKDALACFLEIPVFSYPDILKNPKFFKHIQNFELSLVYCLADGKIYIVTQDEMLTSVSLREMKEWTRRKR